MDHELKAVPVRNIAIILVGVGALTLAGFAVSGALTVEQGGRSDAAHEAAVPVVAQPEAEAASPVDREWLPEEIGEGSSPFVRQGPIGEAEDTGVLSLGRYYALTLPEAEAASPVGREWLPEEIGEGPSPFAGQGPIGEAEDTGTLSLGGLEE